MMTGTARFTFTWTVTGAGWATCAVDGMTMTVSYLTDAPRDLLVAVTRLLVIGGEESVQFAEEPAVHRWFFRRDGDDVEMRIVHAPDHRPQAGVEVWRSVRPLAVLARGVLRAFDHVSWQVGDETYASQWRHPFPRRELDRLRQELA